MAKRTLRRKPARRNQPPFAVVGVGASAGGFEAFSQLLRPVPRGSNLAVILVQHLAPQYGSSLPSLLAPHTQLQVVEVTEGVRLQAGHVYVVPPNVQMELVDGHLHLVPRPDDKTQYNPIDFFFRSMARTLGNRAIAVVLSGTASDGALGIREIKSLGGVTFAQDPQTAKYDGMPRSAISTRMIDFVLPPGHIARQLVKLAKRPAGAPSIVPEPKPSPDGDAGVTDAQLDAIFKLLLPATGVNFMHYKSPTIMRRLFRRMGILRIRSVDEYVAFLRRAPDEVISLHNDLLIHVTRFFREPESFEALSKRVLPELLADAKPDVPIRVWVAGCATGEEAYSLAIVLLEYLEEHHGDSKIQIQIFGTDVSEAAIEFARHGLYPPGIVSDVSPERLRKFFTKSDGGYRITKSVRDLCVFARQDLTRDPPFSRLDLICCRNVLIYMDGTLQKKLLSLFHYALKPTGVLLLGHAESIGYNSELFTLMDKKQRIHRKKPGASAGPELTVSSPRFHRDVQGKPATDTRTGARFVLSEANRIVLDKYAPPSVLVDANFHVVQFNGQTGLYLEPSPGEPSFHVLKLAREGLLHGLRTALQTAKKTRRASRKTGLRVRSGSVWHDVDVEVMPLSHQNEMFYLVLFERKSHKAKSATVASKRTKKNGRADDHRVARLEEELAATREYLQSTIQEIEAANEELQSANEEILSSNEELQSTNEELDTAKEELQSSNEELNTVNDELHGRNEELTRVNGDLLNLLSSVQIAIVIVSNDLRIRRFTPMAEKLLNLIPTDVGRPITQISTNIEFPELSSVISETIDTVTPVERDVRDKQGHSYSLRIKPYKSADNRIDGAVIALFDVDAAKR